MKSRIIICLFLIITIVSCKTGDGSSVKLKYIFNSYKKIGMKEYLDIKVMNGRTNKNILVLVEDWHKLEGIHRTKGVGYRGSELNGLEVEVVGDSITKYCYKSLGSIID